MATEVIKELAIFSDKFGWIIAQEGAPVHLSQIVICNLDGAYYKEGSGFVDTALDASTYKTVEDADEVVNRLEAEGTPCESDYNDGFIDQIARKYGDEAADALLLGAAKIYNEYK